MRFKLVSPKLLGAIKEVGYAIIDIGIEIDKKKSYYKMLP